MSESTTLYCSFCGKSQHEVRKLIAGPTVFICDECVELCNDIIREEDVEKIAKRAAAIVEQSLAEKAASAAPEVPKPKRWFRWLA